MGKSITSTIMLLPPRDRLLGPPEPIFIKANHLDGVCFLIHKTGTLAGSSAWQTLVIM